MKWFYTIEGRGGEGGEKGSSKEKKGWGLLWKHIKHQVKRYNYM